MSTFLVQGFGLGIDESVRERMSQKLYFYILRLKMLMSVIVTVVGLPNRSQI